MRQHIVSAANALLENIKERFAADGAKKAGHEDGLFAEGDQFSFQDECKAAYDGVSLDAGRVVDEIIAHERSHIDGVVGDFPDMEGEVRRRITTRWATDHLESAKELYMRERNQKKFLRERGLPVDGSMTIRGDSSWKFWLPLFVCVVADLYGNYLFLGNAQFRERIGISLTAIVVVFGVGGAISWLLKAARSIVLRLNRWAAMLKAMCWTGVALSGLVFLAALSLLVIYRGGRSTNGSQSESDGGQDENVSAMEIIAQVFSGDPQSLGLALFNVLFFGVTIVTFYKAGWPVLGYNKVHNLLQSAKNAYDKSRYAVDGVAQDAFDAAREEVKKRRADVRDMLRTWNTICSVFAEISNMTQAAGAAIDVRYKGAIKIYRGTFSEYRRGSTDAGLLPDPVPPAIREDAPIAALQPLDTLDHPLQDDLAQYQEKLQSFGKRADEWEQKNSDCEKLEVFLKEYKAQLIDSVKREKAEDLQAAIDDDDEGVGNGQ